MTGCEMIRCPYYINDKCTETNDYVNRFTGEDMCSFNIDAIPRDEYEAEKNEEMRG
jgi:hypothetical protein